MGDVPFQLELVALARVCLAVLLGAVIGVERELADKPAGLRTHMLVAGSAALLIALGDSMIAYWSDAERGQQLQLDPFRLLEALITGIAFLGAGTILRDREGASVSGLTTAASLFFTGVVGAAVAVGQYTIAVGSAVVLLLTLRLVGAFEKRFLSSGSRR
jgi:putative Mg2+ transporter-C (MgtC) family protein